jgi:hypothetical protein
MGFATAAALVTAAAAAASAAQQMSADSPEVSTQFMNPIRMMRKGTALEQLLAPQRLSSEIQNRQRFDPQFIEHELAMQGRSAQGVSQNALDIQRMFAPQFAALNQELLEATNPEAVAARKALGEMVINELSLGRELSGGQKRTVERNVRGAQAARGNILGDAAAFQETMALTDAGDRLLDQRINNTMKFLAAPRPQDQWAGLTTPFAPLSQAESANYRVINPNAGQQTAAAGNAAAANQVSAYSAQVNAPNPWTQGLGTLAGTAGSLGAMYQQNQVINAMSALRPQTT